MYNRTRSPVKTQSHKMSWRGTEIVLKHPFWLHGMGGFADLPHRSEFWKDNTGLVMKPLL